MAIEFRTSGPSRARVTTPSGSISPVLLILPL